MAQLRIFEVVLATARFNDRHGQAPNCRTITQLCEPRALSPCHGERPPLKFQGIGWARPGLYALNCLLP
jgi:hypothetical protein